MVIKIEDSGAQTLVNALVMALDEAMDRIAELERALSDVPRHVVPAEVTELEASLRKLDIRNKVLEERSKYLVERINSKSEEIRKLEDELAELRKERGEQDVL